MSCKIYKKLSQCCQTRATRLEMGQGHQNMVQGGRLDTMFQRDRRTERRSPDDSKNRAYA